MTEDTVQLTEIAHTLHQIWRDVPSRRERIAIAAMQAMMGSELNRDDVCKEAVAFADALLAELARKEKRNSKPAPAEEP